MKYQYESDVVRDVRDIWIEARKPKGEALLNIKAKTSKTKMGKIIAGTVIKRERPL